MSSPTSPRLVDIFCRVIDNFGDIGVCWRLARQLRAKYALDVRLWVDELAALKAIWPSASLAQQQSLDGVEVLLWDMCNFPAFENQMADIVIEAFACELPDSYQAQIAARKVAAPVWINLDYLSAEDWIEDCHGLASVAPATGIKKTFFFPGFTAKSGGLLREAGLINARNNWRDEDSWLQSQGLNLVPNATKLCLFSYETASIHALLAAIAQGQESTQVFVAGGKSLTSVNEFLVSANLPPLAAPLDTQALGNLRVSVLPFLAQTDFDRLLWSMDINFIRGEDSLIRAHWAGAPFMWHIYQQEDDAHMDKLNAFLARFLTGADPLLAEALEDFWRAWNQNQLTAKHWQALIAQKAAWQVHTQRWQASQLAIPDLCVQLIQLINQPSTP